MASLVQLPCNEDGTCMRCGVRPLPEETLRCGTCATPWHMTCLSFDLSEGPTTDLEWHCPDCSGQFDPLLTASDAEQTVRGSPADGLVAAIKAIEADQSLSEEEKARKRQELLSGRVCEDGDDDDEKEKKEKSLLDELKEMIKCSFCMQLPEKPVSVVRLRPGLVGHAE